MTFTKRLKFVSTLWTFFLIATVAQGAIVANVSSPTSSAGLDIYTINITGDAGEKIDTFESINLHDGDVHQIYSTLGVPSPFIDDLSSCTDCVPLDTHIVISNTQIAAVLNSADFLETNDGQDLFGTALGADTGLGTFQVVNGGAFTLDRFQFPDFQHPTSIDLLQIVVPQGNGVFMDMNVFSGGVETQLRDVTIGLPDTPNVYIRWVADSHLWDNTVNWDLGITPDNLHSVVINPPVGLTVLGPTATTSVKSVAIGATNSGVAELRLTNSGDLSAARGTTIRNRGRLIAAGQIGGAVTIQSGGDLIVLSGDTATFSGPVTNHTGGRLTAIGATVNFNGGLTNDSQLNLIDTSVTGSLVNNGMLAFSGTASSVSAGATVVPEPSSFLLAGLGTYLLMLCRRSSSKRSSA